MREYTIRRKQRPGEDCQTMTIIDNSTGDERAEYRLTPGAELAEVAAMRRTINKHLRQPGATMGNY